MRRFSITLCCRSQRYGYIVIIACTCAAGSGDVRGGGKIVGPQDPGRVVSGGHPCLWSRFNGVRNSPERARIFKHACVNFSQFARCGARNRPAFLCTQARDYCCRGRGGALDCRASNEAGHHYCGRHGDALEGAFGGFAEADDFHRREAAAGAPG